MLGKTSVWVGGRVYVTGWFVMRDTDENYLPKRSGDEAVTGENVKKTKFKKWASKLTNRGFETEKSRVFGCRFEFSARISPKMASYCRFRGVACVFMCKIA